MIKNLFAGTVSDVPQNNQVDRLIFEFKQSGDNRKLKRYETSVTINDKSSC